MKYSMVLLMLVFTTSLATFSQRFEPVLDFSDVSKIQFANGISVADFDKDGNPDIYVVAREAYKADEPHTWNRLFRNSGQGFEDVTVKAGLDKQQYSKDKFLEEGIKMGASWGDYDNDGYPDLFLTNHGKDQLWHNKGDGTFENVSVQAGVEGSEEGYSSSALWWDYDNDGDLDLYVSSWYGPNSLFRNDGNTNFTDVSEKSNLKDVGKTWTSIPLDVNKDGRQDLYIVNDFGPNYLYLNESDDRFAEATSLYQLNDLGNGMGVDICDYGGDGNFDIYLTNIWQVHTNPFFVNDGAKFINMASDVNFSDARWGWGARFFDMDHDMDEDLYIVNQRFFEGGNPEYNRLFVAGNGEFEEMSSSYGLDNYADARGQEVFDYNHDGDLDILVGSWGEGPILYNNIVDGKGNWLQIELEGTTSNRDAFGAVLRVKTEAGQFQHRLNHGANFLGQSIKPIHFGLGENETVSELTIFWPGGRVEKIYDVSANQFLKLTEGNQKQVFGETYGTLGNNLITGIDKQLDVPDNKTDLVIFPNPVTNRSVFRLKLSKPGNVELKIHDMLGREIHKEYISTQSIVTDLKWPQHLASGTGTYYYQIITGDGKIIKKVLKQ